jgi:transcriptional regulator with XRE-family HTH domain
VNATTVAVFLAEGFNVLLVAKKKRSWSGQKLRELRTAAEMTQAQLADKAGIYPADVSNYERDKAEPTFTILCQLAAALDVELNAFDPRKGGK